MTLVVYDGSFEGFLSAVFDVYELRLRDVEFTGEENYQNNLFGSVHTCIASEEKTRRVYTGLHERFSSAALSQLYRTFLSEMPNIENVLLSYIRHAMSSKISIEHDYGHAAVLSVRQVSQIVYREKHRMEAFVRFQLTADGLYYAVIEPDFNVLPLIKKHFHERYADQCWMIYDCRRKYGLYYDKAEVSNVSVAFSEEVESEKNVRNVYDDKEELYQKLWQQYFNSVNIAARKNMKLHIQHMPRRYWKYLTEKS